MTNFLESKNYVKSVDLAGIPRYVGLVAQSADEAAEVFDTAKSQALVVGSGVFSFATGVDAEVREAISESALLAQLVANKRFSVATHPLEWFAAYSEVLQNVGWTLQDSGWHDYTAEGTGAEVHEKIIEVMTVALGPSAAALSILDSTVKALRAMEPGSSWFTIFNRESKDASVARFQIGLVEKDAASDVFVSLLACLVKAENTITQILLFKFRQASAHFHASNAKVSINRDALVQLKPTIRTKVRAYQVDYVSGIKELELDPI